MSALTLGETPRLRYFCILTLAVLTLALLMASPLMAQYCMESAGYPKLIFDSSYQGCLSRPSIPRAYYPGLFKYHGTTFLGLSDGNQLKVYGLDDPGNPNLLTNSNFPVSHLGDSDYDLQSRVMCDECRYAFFAYKIQGVFADLGDPASHTIPSFSNFTQEMSVQNVSGGFTFKSVDTQYLISYGLTDQCSAGGAALFKFNSTDPTTIVNNFRSCVETETGSAIHVFGGLYLQDPAYNNGIPYLWLSDNWNVYVFRVDGSGDDVTLQYVKMLPDLHAYAFGSHSLSMAVDLDQGMAVSVTRTRGLVLWDFPNHDLSNPHQVLTKSDVSGNLVAFNYPLLWTTEYNNYNTTNTFRVSGDASNPSLEDIANPPGTNLSFWDASQSWNTVPCERADLGAAFSPDGGNLYVARWAVAQNFDVSGCAGPQIPTAHVKVEKWNGNFWVTLSGSPFPGDQIRVSSTSSGEITTTVITLKDASGAVIDSSSGSATATPLDYTIPVGGGAAEPSAYYTASVDASNAEGSDTDQSTVTVDLSPQGFPAWVVTDASGTPYSGSPQSAMLNDNLTLSATAEGTPGVPVGLDLTDPYQWLVTAPDQTTTYTASGAEPTSYMSSSGQSTDHIPLDQNDTWTIQLQVYYQHLDSGGTATYTYTTTPPEELVVSSVAASMTVATQNPVNTADIVLDGTDSRSASGGADPNWKWEYKLHAATSWNELTSCTDQSTCTIPGSEQTQTLDPGTYDFRLTLTLGQDSSMDEATGVVVDNGLVNYDISVNNSNPDKGQTITFSLTNIGAVDQVTWRFGENGCELSSTVTCTPAFGATCLSQAFSYSTSGSKTVSATVTLNSQQYPLTKNNIVTVSTSGSCSGTTCSYTVSPTSAGLPYTSSTKTFTVSTTSSCTWSASESPSWLRITSGSSGTGPGSVVISADENTDSARSTTMTIAGKSIAVSQDASPCSYTASPEERNVPAAGNTGYTIWVGATSGCSWTATSSANWARIQSGTASGTGNGEVKYDVDENELGSTRSATITIGGARHTINQDAAVIPVDFSFSQDSVDIGQSVRFQVTDSRVTPIRWEFGGPNCAGSTTMDCQFSPDLCRDVTWEYEASGWYSVRLVAQEGEKTHGGLHVVPEGECCYKDGKPTADFTMSPNPVFTGETVSFTDGSSKAMDIDGAGKTTALGFSWTPIQPEIGQTFSLTITWVGDVDSAAWDFGEAGCGDKFGQQQICEPAFGATCMDQYFAYASAGEKTVKLTINGNQSVTQTLTVLDQGSCDSSGGGGGGTTCTYQLSPVSRNFGENGGTGTVSVATQDGCSWTASKSATASWISLNSNSGTGSGSFNYTVAANSGGSRTAKIDVEGQKHTVTQDAHYVPQDTAPTAWHWTVSLDGETIVESDQPNFTASFRHPGTYLVQLDVSNCAGTDSNTQTLQVDQAPVVIPDAYVVPSAVHAPGSNDTEWRTDLRVFNPDDHPVVINIEYQPENTDNSATVNDVIRVTIRPRGTKDFDDILQLIVTALTNDDGSGPFSGSLSVTYENQGDQAVPPMITSRTYNETSDGTFGQFVPAAPAIATGGGDLFLSGLVSNINYRTNVRMANFGDDPAIVQLQLVDKNGHEIGEPIYPEVLPRSTRQVNGIAAAAGVGGALDIFSIRASSENEDARVWVSVVDNSTGDPVLYAPMIPDEDSDELWVPGVAHLAGANDSQWQSDLVFFNTGTETVNARVDYVPSENLGIQHSKQINGLGVGEALLYPDMVYRDLVGVDSKGYLVIKAEAGSSLPAVAGKTYNLDPDGGTFGQNLFVFQKKDLIEENEVRYLPGIKTSPTATTGFRTNLGILNTNEDAWTSISLKALDTEGVVLAEIDEMWLAPGQFLQFNLADRLSLHDVEHLLTVEMTVLSGGPVGAYASEVDNRTQDPILIRAQKVLKK